MIHSFKANYKKSLVKHIIARSLTAQTTIDITIRALDAVCWIDLAWRSITELTIQNTFTAAGFKHRQIEQLLVIIHFDTINSSLSTLHGLSTSLNDFSLMDSGINDVTIVLDGLLKHLVISGSTMTASEFINIDSHVPTFYE